MPFQQQQLPPTAVVGLQVDRQRGIAGKRSRGSSMLRLWKGVGRLPSTVAAISYSSSSGVAHQWSCGLISKTGSGGSSGHFRRRLVVGWFPLQQQQAHPASTNLLVSLVPRKKPDLVLLLLLYREIGKSVNFISFWMVKA